MFPSSGRLLLVMTLLGAGVACKNETTITKGLPALAAPPAAIDWGEVNVGETETANWEMKNTGIADLNILSVTYTGDPEFVIVDAPTQVGANSEVVFSVDYTPVAEEGSSGVITITTDDPAWDVFTIEVGGVGVVARLEISPQSLWFGDIEVGDSMTQSVTLTSWGSGDLEIKELTFPGDEALAYRWELADGQKIPYVLAPGTAAILEITYQPLVDQDDNGQLVVFSNDIDTAYQGIGLYSGEGKGGKLPPEVDILAPGWGTRWIEGQPIALTAHAVDPDNAPTDLFAIITLDGAPQLYIGQPDAKGTIQWGDPDGSTPVLQILGVPAGTHTVGVTVQDPDGHTGEAYVEVTVDREEELYYTVTGGESIFEYFRVDDDLEVIVNGVTVYADNSGETEPSSAPFQFQADVGDVVEIRATDVNPCAREISDLWLYFGTEHHSRMVEATSLSGTGGFDDCNGRDDYDPDTYEPPPFTFIDASFTIDIP